MNFYKKYILPKRLNTSMNREEFERLRPEVIKEAAGIVLEIGFGTGLNLPHYKNITKVYALEPSQELYNFAEERIKQVSFPVEYLPISAENISLPDRSIDSVVSTWTLCSIPDVKATLLEVKRLLKPDGKFLFIEHGKSSNKKLAFLQNIFTPLSKLFAGNCHLNREIEKLIIDSGFYLEKIEKFSEKPLMFMYKGIARVNK